MDAEPLAAGTVLDEKFRILRLLGRGGMGEVYAVRHELTQHERALKLLHAEWQEHDEVVRRFLREASAAGRIDHPHICETYDAGFLSTGEPYVLMELLHGRSLEHWLSDEHQLSVPVAADLVAQACRGIQAAHDAGIVHRDLKPENLLVVERNGAPFVKLLDFGVSKFEDALNTSRATQDGALLGTPYYMSPEQFADGHDVDGRADVYSLGVILYECVTGRPPFVVDTLAQLAKKVMLDEPSPPSAFQSSLPEVVDGVVMRALQKDPERRYASAGLMAQELEKLSRKFGVTFPQGGRDWAPSDGPARGGTLLETPSFEEDGAPESQPEVLLDDKGAPSLVSTTQVSPTGVEGASSGRPAPGASKLTLALGGACLAVAVAGSVIWLVGAPPPRVAPGAATSERAAAPSSASPSAVARPEHSTSAPTAHGRPVAVSAKGGGGAVPSVAPSASVAPTTAPAAATPTPPAPGSSAAGSPRTPAPQAKPEHATADEFPD